jgi:hypothetical protein
LKVRDYLEKLFEGRSLLNGVQREEVVAIWTTLNLSQDYFFIRGATGSDEPWAG